MRSIDTAPRDGGARGRLALPVLPTHPGCALGAAIADVSVRAKRLARRNVFGCVARAIRGRIARFVGAHVRRRVDPRVDGRVRRGIGRRILTGGAFRERIARISRAYRVVGTVACFIRSVAGFGRGIAVFGGVVAARHVRARVVSVRLIAHVGKRSVLRAALGLDP
jgi:hypothetical protein